MVMNKLVRDTVLTLGATDTTISEAVYNGTRANIVLTNTSSGGEVISISIGTAAVDGQGIVLQPDQAVIFSKDSGYTPSNLRISGVDDGGGTGTLAIHEEIDEEVV